MKTPERTVEEFKEKLKMWGLEDNDKETYLFVVEQYTQTLKTERQKREEIVRELLEMAQPVSDNLPDVKVVLTGQIETIAQKYSIGVPNLITTSNTCTKENTYQES